MKYTIDKLNIIMTESNERPIKNLIGRIKYFDDIKNESKLNDCLAEAEMWINSYDK